MTALMETSTPALSRDAILQSFLADAEADTQAVVSVTDLINRCQALKDELTSTHAELVTAYAAASKRPNVAAKLRELGVKNPDTMKVELGGTATRKRAARKSSSRRAQQDPSPSVNPSTNDGAGTASISE
ncbi:hypothetical protein [Mycolicibacterium llatzerense]|uniref:hypothetical protein n=1 Tax=Mycolicibacterium llatzerense TaxID=280871 RepID=UPI0013A6DF1D|nr:hypothetical protein [Mycolicibacterium llatzerense]